MSEENDNIFEDKKEKKVFPSTPKRKGKVANISKTKIIIDVNGNGESISYNEKEHTNLKVGDPIEF